MILEMKVPSPGESITEVEIAEWLVHDGDFVEKDQPIAEVDSDKATLELPAEESGTITLKAEVGDAVAVGAVVCLIDTSVSKPKEASNSKVSNPIPKPVIDSNPKPFSKSSYATGTSSPAAKKILSENGLEADKIKGTGKDGRITKADAINAIPSMGEKVNTADRGVNRSKLSMLRRKVAERLVNAKNETAMLTTLMKWICHQFLN